MDSIAALQPMLILSGGEPLLRPDIFLLARHAVALGMRVSLASNGTTITPQVADEIAACGISRVSISLDGATSEKHDQSRGKGSFQAAMQGIENLRGKVDFQINNTLTSKNESDVAAIFDLAQRVGARALHFFFLVATGRGREEDLISPERQEQLLLEIDRERARRSLEVQVTCAPQYARIARPGKRPRRRVPRWQKLRLCLPKGRCLSLRLFSSAGRKHQGKEFYRDMGECCTASGAAREKS